MKPLVITPTLGRSAHLREAVGSVAEVGSPVRHVLVCPTSEVTRLAREFPGTEVIGDDAPGVYAAICRGLQVDGDWDAWTWLNDDDRWHSSGVRGAIEVMGHRHEVDVVYGKVAFVDRAGRFLGYLPVAHDPALLRPLMSMGVAAISQQGTFARRRLLDEVGTLDRSYRLAADFEWWARAVVGARRFVFVHARVADFRIRAGQLSQQTEAMRREMRAIVGRHFGPTRTGRATLVATWFRISRCGEILSRFARTGCWRTQSLLRRYGGGG